MQRKLTITVDQDVYDGLYRVAGKRNISRFIESLLRPYVTADALHEGYRQMAADTEREAEAQEWIEGTALDVAPIPNTAPATEAAPAMDIAPASDIAPAKEAADETR